MKDPKEFLDQLESDPYNFKLKGSGEITFHLGCSLVQDSTGILCMDPGQYIDKMEESRIRKSREIAHHKIIFTHYECIAQAGIPLYGPNAPIFSPLNPKQHELSCV